MNMHDWLGLAYGLIDAVSLGLGGDFAGMLLGSRGRTRISAQTLQCLFAVAR